MKYFTAAIALLSAVAVVLASTPVFAQPQRQLSTRAQLSEGSSIHALVSHNRDARNKK